jgi:hypothetical protein
VHCFAREAYTAVKTALHMSLHFMYTVDRINSEKIFYDF